MESKNFSSSTNNKFSLSEITFHGLKLETIVKRFRITLDDYGKLVNDDLKGLTINWLTQQLRTDKVKDSGYKGFFGSDAHSISGLAKLLTNVSIKKL